MKNFTSAFLEIFKKAPVDKRAGIHYNGADNLYPQTIENLINDSVTALRCSELMASYIIGKGFVNDNDLIVNEEKQTTLYQFGTDIAKSITDHNGVFIHINYNAELKHKSYDVLPFADCRLSKQDSNKYSGKIVICDDWKDGKAVKNAIKIDTYNPNKEVIRKQIETVKGIEHYKGQVYYYNGGKYIYPLAPLHPASNDASSERQASIYKEISLRKGFFGKTIVVTKPLIDGTLEKGDAEYTKQENAQSAFRSTLQKFIGAENSDGILHMELEFTSDKLEDEIMFKNIESNINDKLFAFTETSVRNNIRMCFNNVPSVLIENPDKSMFGQSGDGLLQAKLFYNDQTLNERFTTAQICNKLFKNFKEPREGLKIVPLVTKQVIEDPKKT